MTMCDARIRTFLIVSSAILMLSVGKSTLAQTLGPDGAPNPTASTVTEQQLLKEAPRIVGDIDQPIERARVLIQPAGRTWDYFHQVTLRWIAAIAIVGMTAALAAAYFIMGQLRIPGGRSGKKVSRFSAFERFAHWLTAVSFVTLGLTGLNITFGRITLLPLIGPEAFSNISQIAKYIHNYLGASFVTGLVLIIALWFKDNIPGKVDVDWIRRGGGFIKLKHAPAGRFNAGEKLVFWFAFFAGTAVIISGVLLIFPFYVTDIVGMQIAQVVHSVVAVLFVAVIIAHIYIGTLGTEGAFEAIATGEVDLNWAKEHHDIWLKDQLANDHLAFLSEQPPATSAE